MFSHLVPVQSTPQSNRKAYLEPAPTVKVSCCVRRKRAGSSGAMGCGRASGWSSSVDPLSMSVICDQLSEHDSSAITKGFSLVQ